MLTDLPTHEMVYFEIPADNVREIVAWINLTDQEYMRRRFERNGRVMITSLNGESVLQTVDYLPEPGTAQPYYGMIGGVYRFAFTSQANDTILQVKYSVQTPTPVEPYTTMLGASLQTGLQENSAAQWYYNRLESILDNPSQSHRMYIDGEIYSNMLAAGWEKESAREYRYEFVPTTIGCFVSILHITSGQLHDLTKDIDW